MLFSENSEDGDGEIIHHDLFLRVPRDQGSILRTVAILQYLETHTDLVAPRVIKWDETKDNPLGFGYVVLSRIPVDPYDLCERRLTHDQKLSIATQLAALYRQMESITSPVAGIIEACQNALEHDNTSADDFLSVQPFGAECCHQPEDPTMDGDDTIENVGKLPHDRLRRDSPGLSVDEIMLAIYQRHMHHSPGCRKEDHDHSLKLYEPLQEMMQNLVDLKIFGSDAICLHRPDLFTRNIMIDSTADADPVITGVVDWDDALFVPRFAAREPPRWLWGQYDLKYYEGGLKEGESILRTPSTLLTEIPPENEDIKRAFTEAIGEDWMAEAEDERLALARALLSSAGKSSAPTQQSHLLLEWRPGRRF
ncbi:hypothetical protein PG994_004437 [Apiospora phragmitis]|uniref:Aminoglycoside phosphotransferase domain-containing protein n=1 Tax=Apiospora phragmitis TaxID=2905665 RepID=A0ABR1VQQ0_9PEZI